MFYRTVVPSEGYRYDGFGWGVCLPETHYCNYYRRREENQSTCLHSRNVLHMYGRVGTVLVVGICGLFPKFWESLFVLSDISMLFFQSIDLYMWFFQLVLSFFVWESNREVLSALLSCSDSSFVGSFVGSFSMGQRTLCLCCVHCRKK